MPAERTPAERKKVLLRLDPLVHDALARWAGDELRSTNAQIEFLLRRQLDAAGRLPAGAGQMRRPGRPGRSVPPGGAGGDDQHLTTGTSDQPESED